MDFFVIWNMFHKSLKTVTVTSFLSHRSVQMPNRKETDDKEVKAIGKWILKLEKQIDSW
jgi:hypothetical protein